MKKVIGILVVMLLIGTAITSAGLEKYTYEKIYSSNQLNSHSIDIIKPEKALYLNNIKLFPLFIATVILGPITIETDVTGGLATKVEFYIDNVLKFTDFSAPFSWLWDEAAYFKHTIKVIAYDDTVNTDEEELSVLIFNKGTSTMITKEEAIEILMSEIMEPASSNIRSSAFMMSEPLKKNDIVSSEDGNESSISRNTWFIFIDDFPEAEFIHDTRYVFMNAYTGEYEIKNEVWPPLINNVSMFDPDNLNRGELIEIYPILNYSTPISNLKSSNIAPLADYGDAPDSQDGYYGVQGRFPTLYNTVNSLFNRPGGHTLNTGEEMLGVHVSAEVDANDPIDPDGVPNLVDSDSDDRSFVILLGGLASMAVTVTVSQNAPDVTRYINMLIDFDQSGNWATGLQGKEWIVINKEIDVSPGTTKTIIISGIIWGTSAILSSPVWMRTSLTREKVDENLFLSVGGWDGSGQFEYGEIEDTLVFLADDPPVPPVFPWQWWWPPLPNNPPKGQPPGGGGSQDPPEPAKLPKDGPCGTTINHYSFVINCGDNCKSKHMKPECDQLDKTFRDLGCTSLGYIGPDKTGNNKNTRSNIKTALENIAKNVDFKCLDHIYILIKGHGNGKSIGLKNSKGRGIGRITFEEIDSWLDISSCPDEDCNKPKVSCYVHIIVSSCYAGKALKDPKDGGLAREGRTVATSSDKHKSYGGCRGYTAGFIKGMREKGSVTDAHNEGDKNQKSIKGKKTDAGFKDLHCDCKCPNSSIGVIKEVWDIYKQEWIDETNVPIGNEVKFSIGIVNDGAPTVTDLMMVDVLPYCLSWVEQNPSVYYNGELIGSLQPKSFVETWEGLEISWDLSEIDILYIPSGDNIFIQFVASCDVLGPKINWVYGEALCEIDPENIVTDEDSATVNVVSSGEDNIPPDIIILYPEDGSNVYYPDIDVTGFANDSESGVVYLEYLWEWTGGSTGDYTECEPGECYVWEFIIELYNIAPGWNQVTMTAIDAVGNPAVKSVTFYYITDTSKILDFVLLKQMQIYPYARFHCKCLDLI